MKKFLISLCIVIAFTQIVQSQDAQMTSALNAQDVQSAEEQTAILLAQLIAIARQAYNASTLLEEKEKNEQLTESEHILYETAKQYLKKFLSFYQRFQTVQTSENINAKEVQELDWLLQETIMACAQLMNAWQEYEADCTKTGKKPILALDQVN